MSEIQWLTVPQVAARLQCHPELIYRAIRGGRLKALRLGVRREWRIHAEWLQAFAEAEATIVNPDAPGAAHALPWIADRPKPGR